MQKIEVHILTILAEKSAGSRDQPDKTNGDILKEQKYLEEEINRALSRNDKVSGLYEKLFEDHAENKVSEEWFMHMSQKYETERLELKNKISRLRKKLAEADALKIGRSIS